jgi:hypothetical protein
MPSLFQLSYKGYRTVTKGSLWEDLNFRPHIRGVVLWH